MKFRTAFTYAYGLSISAAFSLITLPVIAWLYTPADIGRLTIFQVTASLCVIALSLGLDQSYVREFNEIRNTGALAKTCFTPGFFFLAILTLGLLIFRHWVSVVLFKIESDLFVYLLITAIVLLYLERYFSVFIRMNELAFLYSAAKALPKIGFLGLACLAYFRHELTTVSYLIAFQVLAWAIGIVIMYLSLFSFINVVIYSEMLTDELKGFFSYGFPLLINGFIFWALNFADRIMLAKYSSYSEVGIYSIAINLAGVAFVATQVFSTIWHPVIFKWVAQGLDIRKLEKVNLGVQVVASILIGLTGLISWIIPMFLPPAYRGVQYLIVLCMTPPLVIMVREVTGVGLDVTRRTKIIPIITAIAMIINIALNYLLIPAYGAMGAAIATAISFMVYLVVTTEAATAFWIKLSRFKIYCALLAAILSTIISSWISSTTTSLAIWSAYLLVVLFVYKRAIDSFLKELFVRYASS